MTQLSNHLKTIALLGGPAAVLIAVGGLLGSAYLNAFTLLAVVLNVGAYFFSDRLVLGLHRARELPPEEAPRLHDMVAELAHRADMPTPRVFLIDEPQPNAFATGRNPHHGVVAVTTGLAQRLTERGLRGGPTRWRTSRVATFWWRRSRPCASLFIVNPLAGGMRLAGLFATHPPIEDRVRRLRQLATHLSTGLATHLSTGLAA